MSFLDILASYKTVRDDIAAGEFLKAWEDTIPVQQGLIELGRSLGFKAQPQDQATCDEITQTAHECVNLCQTAPNMATAGAIDWKSLVLALVQALLEAWLKTQNP